MSDEEQATSIGKLMFEWRASNDKLGALEAEFMRQSENLRSLASLLARSRRLNGPNSVLCTSDLDERIAKMKPPEYLAQIVDDARSELRRYEDLTAQKTQLRL
jgi:hypothetical protein